MNLRPLTDEDTELVRRWLSRDYIKRWFGSANIWIEEIIQRKTKYSFINHFIVEENGEPFAFCQYYEFKNSKGEWNGTVSVEDSFSIDYMIGEPEFLGKGYGTKIVKLLTETVFSDTDVLRIIVKPEKENIRSRNTLLSAGYFYDSVNDLYVFQKKNSE